jgi:TatD DNase family protein
MIDFHTHKTDNQVFSVYNVVAGRDHQPATGWFSVGLHPWFKADESLFEEVAAAAALDNCVSIGECGLDVLKNANGVADLDWFKRQIQLGCELSKPITVHCVRSVEACLLALSDQKYASMAVFHGANWRQHQMRTIAQAGCFFSLGKALLAPSSQAAIALQTGVVPLDRLLLETDDAELSIEIIYEAAAQLISYPIASLATLVADNFHTLTQFRHA